MSSETQTAAAVSGGPSAGRQPVIKRSRSFGTLWETWGITAVLVVLVLGILIFRNDLFTLESVQRLLNESAYLTIVAAGMTFALLSGTFDLSVGGQLALTACTTLMAFGVGGSGLAIVVALVTGVGCGLVNGALITGLRVPPFVVTLGMLFVFRGIAYILTDSGAKTLPYEDYDSFLVRITTKNFLAIPVLFWLAIVVYAVLWLVLRHTGTGRKVVSFGSSPLAAKFCGISETRMRLFVFALIGLCVGIAALTYVNRIPYADGKLGDGFELDVITVVVLGGTSLAGGKGSLIGTFSAALLIKVLNVLLVDLGIDAAWQRIVTGAVLVAALAIDGLRNKYSGGGFLRRLVNRPPAKPAA